MENKTGKTFKFKGFEDIEVDIRSHGYIFIELSIVKTQYKFHEPIEEIKNTKIIKKEDLQKNSKKPL